MNYIRTEKHGLANYSKIAQTLGYSRDVKQNSAYIPPVNPYDVNFHRAKRNKVAGPGGQTMNAFQEEVGKALQACTSGQITS